MTEPIEFETVEWGRSQIDRVDLELLAELTGVDEQECLERLASHRLEDFASAWREADPQSSAEQLDFYGRTDLYLWELLGWNGSDAYEPLLERVDQLSEWWPPSEFPRALDYGSGVGTTALRLAEHGYAVTIADVPGPTLTFARERLARRGHEVDVLEIGDNAPRLPREAWDVLVCFDVLEHVPDPAGVARRLTRALVRGGGAAILAAFDTGDSRFPHHLASGRERFDGGRWERFLHGLGMAGRGDCYRRTGRAQEWARAARYRLWRATGLYVTRPPR